jgi:uncharacterized membrane protein
VKVTDNGFALATRNSVTYHRGTIARVAMSTIALPNTPRELEQSHHHRSDGEGISSHSRIDSLDIIRGTVMVLMAIDHVRVYSGLPAGGPTPSIFFTRWVTHFCAPIFVFLAGTGAYLYRQKQVNIRAVARYLAVRGSLLVLLELTLLRLAWTFNFDYRHYLLAGVIWVIGWCMILMALLVRLPTTLVGALGVAVIIGHNLVDPFLPRLLPHLRESNVAWIWQILYFGGPVELGADGPTLMVLYSIVPWIGVMAAGYAFGVVMRWPAERRNRMCFHLGIASILLFLLLRGFNVYGDPRPWHTISQMPPLLALLNTNKYPASLLFLLMTLGPMLVAIPLLDRARGPIAEVLKTFGRVPLFYYLLHIPLIHAVALLVSVLRLGSVDPWLFANHPMGNPAPPDGYTWSLSVLYTVWAAVIVLLYVPCQWFAQLKIRRRDTWLSFL